MRRLLLALPLCIPFYAHAQQAANPVEPFSYGVRTGTAKNPLHAVLSSVVPSAQAGSTQAASPVELFSYGRRVGTQSNPIYVNLDLSAYLTTSEAAKTYLPLSGGTMTGTINTSRGGFFGFCDANGDCGQLYNEGGRLLVWNGGGGVRILAFQGTGNAYACLDASGNLYRSSTACQ